MWDVLGIEPTNEERAIKRAYAKLLKQNRPDKDPAAFQELRDAYEWCLRATKWADYDEYDDFDGEGAPGDDVADDATDRSAISADDDENAPEEEPDPFLPPDGPVERIVVADTHEVVETSSDLPAWTTVDDSRRDGNDPQGGEVRGHTRDDATFDPDTTPASKDGAFGDGVSEASPSPFETLVTEFENLLGDSARAQRGEVWQAWFETADEFSLHERQVLRSVIVDLTAIAWHDQPERTEQILKELPHPAVIGLSDLLGWPHSQVEMSEHIPDDLVLLLGDVLEFDMITADDRAAFFGPSDPMMVDASMRPDNRRHRNGFIFGPFWCLYRRQFGRTAMVIGGPIIISIVAGLLNFAGIQVLGAFALFALFPFFKAGDVRIRWFFVCFAAAIAMIVVLGATAVAPALYIMLAASLHIEAGIKGRQWREAQLQGSFARMPQDMRTDTDRRHSYLSKAGAPSRWAPWVAGAIMLVVLSFLVLGSVATVLSR